jgi:hypothetical protein
LKNLEGQISRWVQFFTNKISHLNIVTGASKRTQIHFLGDRGQKNAPTARRSNAAGSLRMQVIAAASAGSWDRAAKGREQLADLGKVM